MKRSLSRWLALAVLMTPLPLRAQTNGEGLAHLVPDLLLTGITLPGAGDPGSPHAGHFTLGNPTFGGSQGGSRPDVPAIRAVEAFGDRLRTQFANFPLGSSTGGFTFNFNEQSGIYTRNTESFGPAFTERAATIGRKKFSLGVNYQHTSFDTFGGQGLEDGSISITHVALDADVQATILRLSSTDNVLVHTFTQGQNDTENTFSDSGSATGIGDVVLRTKYNFLRAATTWMSLGIDVRLPTGDADNLIGLGTTQGKFFLIASSSNPRVSPHVNIGFTLSGEGNRDTMFQFEPLGVSDEFNYSGGVEIVAHPKLTLLADVLGRTLFDAGIVELETKTFPFRAGAGSTPATAPVQTSSTNPLTGQPYEQLGLRDGNLSLLLGSAGFKFNAGTNLLVGANVLFPITDAGLRDRLTFAFGLDYAF
jgi:hypothetical protein